MLDEMNMTVRKRKVWIGRTRLALAAGAVLIGAPLAAHADIGLDKNGITDGFGYSTDLLNLTLYGVWDVGVGRLDHSYSGSNVFASTVNPYNLNGSPKAFNGLFSSGVSMSRIGLQGDKEIGGDVKVFFKLESAINSITGNISNNGKSIYTDIKTLTAANGASAIDGQWFSRTAYVGVSHPVYGSVEFGRTTNFSLDQVGEYDPVQAALLFSPLGFSGGIGGGLGATENTRLDNSIRYENSLSGVSFGAQYKFAGSKSDQEVESAYVLMLGYNNGPLGLKATYSQTFNTLAYQTAYSNVVAPDPNVVVENTTGYMLSGKYEITPEATAKIGYEFSDLSSPSNRNLDITRYYGLTMPSASTNQSGKTEYSAFWTGGDYKFTKDFDIGVGYYNIDTFFSPENGKEYHANAYSILADYTVLKGLDLYAGAMLMDYSGIGLDKKLPTHYIYPHNAMYGTGVRLKF